MMLVVSIQMRQVWQMRQMVTRITSRQLMVLMLVVLLLMLLLHHQPGPGGRQLQWVWQRGQRRRERGHRLLVVGLFRLLDVVHLLLLQHLLLVARQQTAAVQPLAAAIVGLVVFELVEHLAGDVLAVLGQLEALPTAQKRPVLEHVTRVRMQRPVAALARLVRAARNLDEAIVERQIVAQRVLPALRVLAIVREAIHDEFVDFVEREHLLLGALDRHEGERYVRVRRLLVAVRAAARTRHVHG